ncbi:DUF1178 family protein [Candidatus Puniceispirillum marinum]|uniref:DUF1178 family protein n=1 Tax=Puniceispirillum marinum (strain IMCC1322) TaxID=488538 RepID=D5BMX5_PUNMI|nr:DUF1178 family protein [Candidatus Puniceispirillum marinum]ADE40168.1 Protein of unknown function DUF1178 [Candidatus Puniceispirillum marinum IMCC1322]
MIKYQLICENAHSFEGWFQNAGAYDDQKASGDIACPVCEITSVKKALMTPSLASPKMRKTPTPLPPTIDDAIKTDIPVPKAGTGKPAVESGTSLSMSAAVKSPVQSSAKPPERISEKAVEQMAEMMSELRQLQRKVRSECRDVGNDFAEEARKMHYGEAEPEGIYGHATAKERAELDDEGIDIVELPLLPLDN